MNARTIRKAYLDFFKERGHAIVPRANLVPKDDATTLFTGSGMQPMVPYLLGAKHPAGIRIADSETVFRAIDIDEVGDTSHLTFYEMLGNWSLGDYFKKEQISWIFEFLIDVVELDLKRLYITCYNGSKEFGIPRDDEAAEIWQELFKSKGIDAPIVEIGSQADGYKKGMQDGRIFFYDGKENWWSRGGSEATTPIGDPCGPDSEMMYEFPNLKHDPKFGPNCHVACDCGRFSEIGNSVFMGFVRTETGFEKLVKQNIDFGGGLERIASAVEGSGDIYKISVVWPIVEKVEALSGKSYRDYAHPMRIVADHVRAAFWLAIDGVVPSNTQQGYVMRRLIRRAIRHGLELGIANDLFTQLAPTVADIYRSDFSEINERKNSVIDILSKEEKIFRQTLRKGLKEFEGYFTKPALYDTKTASVEEKAQKMGHYKPQHGALTGELLFKLYDTYGFPAELSKEEATVGNIRIADNADSIFHKLMHEQKERSRTATTGQFKGGLGGHSDAHKKYHTATHLLYKALKIVLGDHVVQRGSNITEERLRFDFSHPQKVTPEETAEVEKIVNENIQKDWPMGFSEMPPDEAFKQGALGAFGDKYGDKVKVYTAGDPNGEWFSKEICGGPHVEHTRELATGSKTFKIIKEEASSAGVRRIKAVLQ